MLPITERQLEIMKIVWSRGSSTVREAKNRLADDPPYTTVLTVFQTLEDNGHLSHEREGRRYRYHPETSRRDAARILVENLVQEDEGIAEEALELLEEELGDEEDSDA